MARLKQKEWLFSISRCQLWLCAILLLFAFTACKKIIREVEVKVYNVDTNEGIPNIELFTESGGEYVTDNRGIAIISGEGNLYGRKINTRLTIDGYGHADYFETCEVGKTFEIKKNELEIPLLKNNYVKITAYESSVLNRKKVCVVFPDRPCPSDLGSTDLVELYRLNSNGELESPRFSNGNTRTILLATDAEKQRVNLFYNSDCSNIEVAPDSTFTITIVKGDTTRLALYI